MSTNHNYFRSKDVTLVILKNRLIFIYQYFYPEVAASAHLLTDLAVGLCAKGYIVNVITAQPTYTSRQSLPPQESFNGVKIERVHTLGMGRKTLVNRISGALFFFGAALLKLSFCPSGTTLVFIANPPMMPLIGWFFYQIRKQPYYILVHDIYPDIAVGLNRIKKRSAADKLLTWCNRLSFRYARKVVTLTEKMAECLNQKYALDNILVISNWADGDKINPRHKRLNPFRAKHGYLEKFVALFSGNLGMIYNFDEIFEAADRLDRGKNSNAEFLFIGNGPRLKSFQDQVAARQMSNIKFLPYQSEEDLPYSLTCGDIAVIPLRREVADLCMPEKTYCALAAGIPLLTIAPRGSALAELVRIHDCGWNIEPGDSNSLTELISTLAQNPSMLEKRAQNARACYERYFTRERAIDQYDALFRETINSSSRDGAASL